MRARKTDRSSVQSGFTLVELLIVVALIAILATLVLPYFDHYRHKAAIAAAQGTAHCLETGFTGFDPTSSNPAERLPQGVVSQLTLLDAGTLVGCKMRASGAIATLASSVLWRNCQMIFICPDGREISATCSADPNVVCGNGPPIRADYLMTLGVPKYLDTIQISSKEPMVTQVVTNSIPNPTP